MFITGSNERYNRVSATFVTEELGGDRTHIVIEGCRMSIEKSSFDTNGNVLLYTEFVDVHWSLVSDFKRFVDNRGITKPVAELFIREIGILPISSSITSPYLIVDCEIRSIPDTQVPPDYVEFLGVQVLSAFANTLSTVTDFKEVFPGEPFTERHFPKYLQGSITKTLQKFSIFQGVVELDQDDLDIVGFLGFTLPSGEVFVRGDEYVVYNNYNSVTSGYFGTHVLKYTIAPKSYFRSMLDYIRALFS